MSDSAATTLSRLSIARTEVMQTMQPCVEGPRVMFGDMTDSRVVSYLVDARALTKLIEAAGDARAMPSRDAARRYRSMVPKRSPAQMIDALHQAIEDSRKSLNKIGEGDWTPQDTAHSVLLARIEVVLANVPFRTGRIVHGDAE